MPIRWVISPRVLVQPINEITGLVDMPYFAAKVAILIDAGTGGPYKHSSAISTGNFCLSFVRGADFSAINSDSDCINLLERDYEDAEKILTRTLLEDGWTQLRLNRLKTRLENRGVDTTGLTRDTTFREILRRMGNRIVQRFKPESTWVL